MTDKTAAQLNQMSPKVLGCTALLIGVPILLLIAGLNGVFDGPKPTTSEYQKDDIGAKIACEEMVKQDLKAPSSADFSGLSGTTIMYLGSSRYRVRGYVDAQNSFGAMLRSNYTCEATDKGSGHWERGEVTLSH